MRKLSKLDLDRTRASLFLVIAVPLFAAACGARSEILDAGASSSTSDRGPVSPGPAVEVATPVIEIDEPADARQPSVVVLDTDPPTAAVVYSKQVPGADQGPALRVAAFPAWGAWPPPLPAPVDMVDDHGFPVPGISFLAASSRLFSPTTFVLLFRNNDLATSTLAPIADAVTGGLNDSVAENSGGEALALVPDASFVRHLGATNRHPPDDDIALQMFLFGNNNIHYKNKFACGTTPPALGAAPGPNGWIVAAGVGTDFSLTPVDYPCQTLFGDVEPATTMAFTRMDPESQQIDSTFTMAAKGTVSRVQAAPRSDGAWVVWSLAGSERLEGVSLDGSASVTEEFRLVSESGQFLPDSFALDRCGDEMILAVAKVLGDGSTGIEVLRRNSGQDMGSTVIPTQGAVDGPIRMVASPTGNTHLLAWAEQRVGAQGHRVRLVRVECLDQP